MILLLINFGLWLICGLLLLPLAMFALEVFLAVVGGRMSAALSADAETNEIRAAVLIPAHNEQAVIERTLKLLLPQLPPMTRALVVADNCSDQTAAIARALGAEVVERFHATERGKGYALDFGMRHLASDPPEVVVIVDADCDVTRGAISKLIGLARSTGRVVQGAVRVTAPAGAGPLSQISALAYRFKNLVRALGLSRLAGITHLAGTGMALPWQVIQQAKLATANVVEDMQLGIDLIVAKSPPLFFAETVLTSPLPAQQGAIRSQRTRWEHGHLQMIAARVPGLLIRAVRGLRWDLFCLALDLAIPPLSLLLMTYGLGLLVCLLGAVAGGSSVPALVLGGAGGLLVASIVTGWWRFCRHEISGCVLLQAPLYALGKLPIYFAFLGKRQSEWVRTHRDPVAIAGPRQ